MMARLIESLKQEISARQRRIQILRERLMKLQSQPNPGRIETYWISSCATWQNIGDNQPTQTGFSLGACMAISSG